jgi:hypothetical protein
MLMRADAVRVTRRGLQLGLGACWLIDAGLQMQPFMFTPSLARDVLASAADGQPTAVARPVTWAAGMVAAHPVPWNVLFVLVQLTIAVGLLHRSTAKPALALSVGWGLIVWYLGEGLGGVLSGGWLPAGAPGPALMYVVLAVAAWPTPRRPRSDQAVPRWLLLVWAVYWVGGVVLQTRAGLTRGADVAAAIAGDAGGAPGWVSQLDFSIARSANRLTYTEIVVLLALQATIGLAVFGPVALRVCALWAGIAVSLSFWVFGQGLGNLTSGTATDVNTAPLVVLLAVAVLGATERRRYARGNSGRAADRRIGRAVLSPRSPF